MTYRKLLWTALAACAASAAQAQQGAPQLIKGADPSVWEGLETQGPIVHRASKVALPAQLEGFERTEVMAVGPEDAIAKYLLKDGALQTIASVYLFRPGDLPEHRLKGSVNSFATANASAFLWSSGPFAIGPAPRLHGSKLVFKTGIGPDTVMDYLYFVPLGRWTAKVRATMTGIKGEGDPEGKLDAFVRGLPWAQLLAANGECSGTACTVPGFDPFRSHYPEMMLSKLLGATMKFDRKKEAKLPVVGRATASILGEVEIRSSDGNPLLYVATVPKLATYRIVRLPDAAKGLFSEGFGRMSIDKPVYALLIDSGDGSFMTRLYNGEPTREAFAKDINDLVEIGVGGPFLPVKTYAASLPD
jgi:hypothetical protein